MCQSADADHVFVIGIPLHFDLLLDLFLLGRIFDLTRFLRGDELRISAEQNVGAAAGHVRGDGDGAFAAGLRDDLGFALVVLALSTTCGTAVLLERRGERFRFLDGDGADQRRLSGLLPLFDLFDDGVEFLALGAGRRDRACPGGASDDSAG